MVWHPLTGRSGPDAPMVPVLHLGAPDGPPVVLVPGLTDGLHPVSRRAARRLYEHLPVPMDRCRGLVASYREPLTAPVTTAGLAADLAEVVAARVDAPVVVIAHSMGTMVAQHLAAARPDLIAGLVLSAPLVVADAAVREILGRWATLVRAGRWEDLADDALACSYTGDELLRRREVARALPPEIPDEALAERHLLLSDACLTHDASAVLASIVAPTLILGGDADPIARPEQAQRLADALPAARLHLLPGLAHGFPEEASGAFTSFVTAFFGEVAGRDAAWARHGA